jgi:hypothetical protein
VIHFETAVALADWPGRCPCGSAAEHRYGLCAKCSARAAWKRRKAPARHKTRRATRRISRRLGRLLPAPRIPRRPAIARTTNQTR